MQQRAVTPLRSTVVALAALLGAGAAWSQRWTADDAFISFRYARNLVEGQGLVFNAGEYVEGYTNFLWTLLCAAGLAAGADAELFAQVLGVSCYVGLIILLGARSAGTPLAAIAVAAHPDLWTFATSGLETSLFSLLAAAGLLLAIDASDTSRRLLSGLLLGLCVLTRPDGMIFAAVGVVGGCALRRAELRARLRVAIELGSPVALLAAGQLAFRLAYYGEWLPNTFFAKSAAVAWYEQGVAYFGFFAQRSWALAIALVGALWLLSKSEAAERGRIVLLLVAAASYSFFVVRVGGDFMYARLLVPTVPLWLLALERASVGTRRLQNVLTAALACAFALSPLPSGEAMWQRGIVDERGFPDPERDLPGRAQIIERFLGGLPVTVAFTGGDARLMYRARVPVAIESETGLTDHFIARQQLRERGRVGHEKPAPVDYLVRQRGAHLVLRRRALLRLRVAEQLPLVELRFGELRAWLLHWDRELIAELRRRGAVVPDFERSLDAEIARLPSYTDLELSRRYERLERFYFAHVDDEARHTPFTRRLPAAEGRSR